MTTDIVIAKLDSARTALAEAKTIQETKKIIDIAVAAEIYAKRQELGEEAVQYATSIKIEALRQLGTMLKESPKNEGGRPLKTPTQKEGVLPTRKELGLDYKTSKLAQDIANLSDEKIEEVKHGIITISKALKNVHVSHNSGENEWYTPPQYIEAAVKTMGNIDCDPASSGIANKIVGAKKFYMIESDGLKQKWGETVWMNPPYAQPLISQFCSLLVEKINSGEVKQACVLVNNATETGWFQNMLRISTAICLITGRIKFLDVDGKAAGAPLQGQVILYFGKKIQSFIKEFCSFGIILSHAK
jgi:hypothetical protein